MTGRSDFGERNCDTMKHNKTVLSNGVTLLNGVEGECCIYLVEGSEKALVIDTGLGSADLREEIEALTQLPYQVVNTHGHGDHTGGNPYFSTVYLSREAEPDARDSLSLNRPLLSTAEAERLERLMAAGGFEAQYLTDGFVFDLGDRRLEVIEIPGHTPGCVALLDKENRLLFSGDCVLKAMDILLVVPQALSVNTYLASMKKLWERSGEFDFLCTGHDAYLVPKAFLGEVIQCCEAIVSGEAVGDDLELPPVFGDTHAKRLPCSDFAVAYRPNRIF